ncbi:MAG: tetratricopeptide repeat protein [Candidatus Zixiibacteriota bacterium]
MSSCTDKRFRDLRHGYELGLLSPEDERAFELHMFDCDACFEAVKGFHSASQHLVRSDSIRESVAKGAAATEEMPQPKRRFWRTFVPATAIVLLMLILKPWQIEIHTDDEVIASENRMVIACFANLAEQDETGRLGEAVSNLLITDLAESDYLQVVSSQRIYDILKGMGLPEECQIDPEISTEIAQKARARWLLTGSIIRDEPEMVITSQLIDMKTGNTVATQRVSGDSIQNIFSLVDKLSVEVKSDLVLPEAALQEPDPSVAEVTTHSPQAYTYYLDGISNLNKFYRPEAADAFLEAIKYDSTFAMAYYHLAELSDSKYVKQAETYINHASKKDQYLIRSRIAAFEGRPKEATNELKQMLVKFPDEKDAYQLLGNQYFNQGKIDSAIQYYLRVIDIDPFNKLTYNQLAYSYNRTGEYKKSLWAINKYIEIAPNEANPYDSRGEIYANMGLIDESISSYLTAIQIKPEFSESWYKLGTMYLYKDQPRQAEYCLKQALSIGQVKYQVWIDLLIAAGYARVYNFAEADKQIDNTFRKYDLDTLAATSTNYIYTARAMLLAEQGEYDSALAILDVANRLKDTVIELINGSLYTQIAIEAGKIDMAKREINRLADFIEAQGIQHQAIAHANGCLALYNGEYEEAVAFLEKALKLCSDRKKEMCMPHEYQLAYAYLKAGRLDEAIVEFRQLHTDYNVDRAFYSLMDIKSYYYLGLAYEQSNRLEEAAETYRHYLARRQQNAPNLREVVDAAQRLAKIEKNL